MSDINELRKLLNDSGSYIDEGMRLVDKISVETGNEIFDKHVDGIKKTLNKVYVDLSVLNTKVLRAARLESINAKKDQDVAL